MRLLPVLAAACLLATPALGQSGQSISAEEALRIAREQGVIRLKSLDREDYGWEAEGWTADGREIEVEINHNGSIRDVEYD